MGSDVQPKRLDFQQIRETALCLMGGAGALALNERFNPKVNFQVLTSPNSFRLGPNPAMGVAKIISGFAAFLIAPVLAGGLVGAGNALNTLRGYPEMTTKDQESRDLIRSDAHAGLILNSYLHAAGMIVGLLARFTPRFGILYGAAVVAGISAMVVYMPQIFLIPPGSNKPISVKMKCSKDKDGQQCIIQNRREIERDLEQTIPVPE